MGESGRPRYPATWLAVVFCLALASSWAAVGGESPLAIATPSAVKSRLEAALAQAVKGQATIATLAVRPLDGEVEVGGLVLIPGQGLLKRLELPEAIAEIDILPLFKGELRIRSIRARGLRLILVETPGHGPPPTKPPLDPQILSLLDRLVVESGYLSYVNPETGLRLDLPGIELDGRKVADTVYGTVGLSHARFEPRGIAPVEIRRLLGRFTWRAPRFTFSEVEVQGPTGKAQAEAVVSLASRGLTVQGRMKGTLDLFQLLGGLGTIGLKGKAQVEASFMVPKPGDWLVQGVFHNEGPIEALDFHWLEGAGKLRYTPAGFELTEIRAKSQGESLVERMDIHLKTDQPVHVAVDGDAAVPEFLDWLHAGSRGRLFHGRAGFHLDLTSNPGEQAPTFSVKATVRPDGSGLGQLTGTAVGEGGPEGNRFHLTGGLDGGPIELEVDWSGRGFAAGWSARAALRAAAGPASAAMLANVHRYLDVEQIPLPKGTLPQSGEGLGFEVLMDGRGDQIDRLDIPFRINRPRYGPTPMALLEGITRVDGRTGWFTEARLSDAEGQGFFARFAGRGDLPLKVTALFDRMPLPVLREYIFGAFDTELTEMEGTITGSAAGTYGWDHPQMTVIGDLSGRIAGGPPIRVWGGGPIDGDIAPRFPLAVTGPGITAEFTGMIRFPWSMAPWGLHGPINGQIDLGQYARHEGWRGFNGRLAGGGEIHFEGFDRPLVADGGLGWGELGISGVTIPAGNGLVSALADGLALDVQSQHWRAHTRLTGPFGTPRAKMTFEWEDLDFYDFAAKLQGGVQSLNLAAISVGRLGFEGPLFEPDKWEGSARLEKLDLSSGELTGKLEAPAEFDIEAGGWFKTSARAPLVIAGSSDGRIAIAGQLAWLGSSIGKVDLKVGGNANLALLELFNQDLLAGGRVVGEVKINGSLGHPELSGRLAIEDGRLRLLPYTEAVDRLFAKIDIDPNQYRVTEGKFRIGGGEALFSGGILHDGWRPSRFDFNLSARDVALNIPKGVWGRYNADLQVVGPATEPEIRGDVKMVAGRFSQPFAQLAPSYVRFRTEAPTISRLHWVTRIGFRLHLSADDSLAIRNESAQLQAGIGIDITGDLGKPLFVGNVVLLEGGRFTFRDNEYQVVSGQVTFDDPRGELMRVRIKATTDVRSYQVRLELEGTSQSLDAQLSSTPTLSNEDILMLLVTGQTPEERGGSSTGKAPTELATSYFGTQIGEVLLARPFKDVLGLNKFQLSPVMVGPEARPTARVTLGRPIGEKTTVIYSRDLSAIGRDVYRIERDLGRTLRLTFGRETLGGIAADLRWLHRFGEEKVLKVKGTTTVRLGAVKVNGLPTGFDLKLGRDLSLKVGQEIPRFQLIQAREALRGVLVDQGYLEARVSWREELRPHGAGAEQERVVFFDVDSGPAWKVRYEGPESAVRFTRGILRDLWSFSDFRPGEFREAVSVVKEAFGEQGQPTAMVEIDWPDPAQRELVVRLDPGPKASVSKVRFKGVRAIPENKLMEQVLLRPVSGLTVLPGMTEVYRPRLAEEDAEVIRTMYAKRGFLETTVTPRPRFRGDGEAVILTFVVEEGPQAKIGSLRVEGDWPEELGSALMRLKLKTGDFFNQDSVDAAEGALRTALDRAGYFESRVTARLDVRTGQVDLVFHVRAGRSAQVESIRYEGLSKTRRKLVQEAVKFKVGDPLSIKALRDTEAELFKLGVFRRVQLNHAAVEDDPTRRAVTVVLDENPNLSLMTAFGYDTEERFRGSVTLSNDNLWGLGRTGSLSAFNSAIRSGLRATLEDRHLQNNRVEGLLAVGIEREDVGRIVLQTTGGAIQLGSAPRLEKRWMLRWQFEDNRFTDIRLTPEELRKLIQNNPRRFETVRLGGLIGSLIIDCRDNPFLPRKGWIGRTELGAWTRAFASQETFIRWTTQLAGYLPSGRLVAAGSVRAGLAWPLSGTQTVPYSQRFFAGGSDSLRGFQRDKVGPQDQGIALGGEAMLVGNFEARYKFWHDLNVLLFYDVGNIWQKAPEFYSGKLRKVAGMGLRYDTLVGSFRLEYGWKLDRKNGESSGEFLISIGEAF